MPEYIDTFNTLVSFGVIALMALCVLIAFNLIFLRSYTNPVLVFFKKFGFLFGFLTALGSVVVSLFYSGVIGFPPCELCWIQRIFLYPQVVLLGMDLYKKDHAIVDHSMALAILGSLTSLFHIYIEHGGSSSLACATGAEGTISCATRYVYEFNFLSIPVMALTASVFILLVLINYKYMLRRI